jgi:cephalosporin-C deacetylase-like acetyl esterase
MPEVSVQFPSDNGEMIQGTLFRPEGAKGRLPTIVAAGGWCYTKEIVLYHVARIVNTKGVQFLAFDYVGFGESTGTRRQHLDPWAQISDYKNALTYVESRDDVDGDKLGVFGISYSGGHVLILAATDSRIKSVVSVVPVIDGFNNMRRSHGEKRYQDFQDAVLKDRRERMRTGKETSIAFASQTPEEVLTVWPYPRVNQVFKHLEATEAPLHKHYSTMESAELLLNYNALPFAPRILNQNVMMIVAEGDNITSWDTEIEAFNKIASPFKSLQILKNVSHMSLYSEEADTNKAASLSRDWFSSTLL